MSISPITPCIAVAIGRQTRLYHAFITTAPPAFDAPSTVTLHAGPLADVSSLAADAFHAGVAPGRTSARLVLIDAVELGWQRARYREGCHHLITPDPVLVGLNTLQQWLWQRLTTRSAGDAYTARAC